MVSISRKVIHRRAVLMLLLLLKELMGLVGRSAADLLVMWMVMHWHELWRWMLTRSSTSYHSEMRRSVWKLMLLHGVGSDGTAALLLMLEHLLARFLAIVGGVGRAAEFR